MECDPHREDVLYELLPPDRGPGRWGREEKLRALKMSSGRKTSRSGSDVAGGRGARSLYMSTELVQHASTGDDEFFSYLGAPMVAPANAEDRKKRYGGMGDPGGITKVPLEMEHLQSKIAGAPGRFDLGFKDHKKAAKAAKQVVNIYRMKRQYLYSR
jgi:hypothetical protein